MPAWLHPVAEGAPPHYSDNTAYAPPACITPLRSLAGMQFMLVSLMRGCAPHGEMHAA